MRRLHPDEVREIFRSLRSYHQLAHDYSVHVATISRIKNGKQGGGHTEGMTPELRRPGRDKQATSD